MKISIVAALGKNRVIGSGNSLPWHLPADMKHFRELAAGKPVIMGRKTFESIGKPLPQRTNIILTRDQNYQAAGCIVTHTLDEALHAAADAAEVMVIGGAQIYEEFLPRTARLYLTYIDHDFPGDTYFPEFNASEWKETARQEHAPDEKNSYHYAFITLERT